MGADLGHHAGELVHEAWVALEDLLHPPPIHGGPFAAGLLPRTERWFERIAWAVVVGFAALWAWTIAFGPGARGRRAPPLANSHTVIEIVIQCVFVIVLYITTIIGF